MPAHSTHELTQLHPSKLSSTAQMFLQRFFFTRCSFTVYCASVLEILPHISTSTVFRWQRALRCRRKHRKWIRDFIAKPAASPSHCHHYNTSTHDDQLDAPNPNFAADHPTTTRTLTNPLTLESGSKASNPLTPITSNPSALELSPRTNSNPDDVSKSWRAETSMDIVSALIQNTNDVPHSMQPPQIYPSHVSDYLEINARA